LSEIVRLFVPNQKLLRLYYPRYPKLIVIIFGDAHGPEKKTSSVNVNATSDEPSLEKQQVKAKGQNFHSLFVLGFMTIGSQRWE